MTRPTPSHQAAAAQPSCVLVLRGLGLVQPSLNLTRTGLPLYNAGVWLWGAAGYQSGLAVPQVTVLCCVSLPMMIDFAGWCTSPSP